jgi:Zn-dependent M28 family amino/carboxypeptidase
MYVKSSPFSLPMIYISPQTAAAILNLSATEISRPENIIRGIYPTRLSLTLQTKTDTLQSTNVIGFIPGTDLKDEYVFITAHYDHLGKKDSVIYFGADDDGSGTATVLQLAETFAKAKKQGAAPRRSIVFMTVSGEEKGLWGSDYYTSHPVFPLSKTSVDLNIDMVGRIDPKFNGDSLNYVYLIGENKLSSLLQPISDSINNNYLHMELDRRFNDPNDPERFYYRSDHFNFAKNGVPIIFYFNGTHADYHKPTDTVDKIQFSLMEKRARLVFYTAWDMANRNEMLPRDKPL